MAMTKVKNLQMWCKRMADGYRDVEVRDMAASWKSGLAFCAIVHRFRPDLIDYDSLSKENIFDNNQLAFEVAERELGIAAFLEAADMVAIRVPDRLSVVTYVSQYYNYFHDKPQLGGPGVREAQTPPTIKISAAVKSDAKTLTPAQQNARNTPKTRQETLGDKCTMCHEKVYLLERHIENGKLFHRSCFRRSDLSPQSKVFKRHPFGSNDEDKKDTVQNKFRKIGTDQDSSSKNGSSEGDLDFWQRRARAKVKDSSSQDDVTSKSTVSVDKDSKTNSNASVQNAGTPVWKRSKDVEMIEENQTKFPPKLSPVPQKRGFQVDDKETKSSSAAGKPNNLLANKFKELEERTLNNSGNSKEKNADKNITLNVKLIDKTTAADKNKSESKSDICSPVAKPRHIKKQIENMDTSEERSTAFQPKPSPRVQRSQDNTRAISSPRTVSPTPTCKSPVQYKSDFSRPKTPPQKQTTGLSLHNDTTNKDVREIKKSDQPAPPLPVSSPPSVPKTQPRKVDISLPKSPQASPRFEPKKTKHEVKVPSVAEFRPSKPPRVSANVENSERSGSPMEAVTTTVPSKAVVHEPKAEPAAMFVVPDKNKQNEETKSREIFGGLLKSLADVRTKYDADAKPGNTNSHHGPTSKVTFADKNLTNTSAERSGQKFEKVKVITKIETKTKEVSKKEETSSNRFNKPARPKSSFVSGRYDVTETKKETSVVADIDKLPTKHIADKSKLTTHETKTTSHKVELRTKEESDIPLWKQQLDKRKAERERPKSADILGDKTNNENKPAWQKEAEQRIMARNGKYVDPEKPKIDSDVSKNTPTKEVTENKNASSLITPVPVKPEFPVQRKVPERKPPDAVDEYIPTVEKNIGKDRNVSPANIRRRILPTAPKEAEKEKIPPLQPAGDRKKIGVEHKFVFEEIETTITPKKPPRPPHPPSPKSPGAPSRPPPPKKESPGRKPVLTAYQIQKQLQLIDSRLTHLELKGRTLEDSIRNAEAEEEDDLMIGWFTLVNEKNELVRKEADVIYLSREQELEGEQQTIDDQLQRLLHKPDHLKTEEERQEEAYLIDKKLDVVNQRSYIVDSIDEDRLRYEEEDRDIEEMIKKKVYDSQKKKRKKARKLGIGFLKDDKDGNVMKKNKKKSKLPS